MDSLMGDASRGALRLPRSSELVEDADEEVFLLYSDLQRNVHSDAADFRGLGYVDSRTDILTVELEFQLPRQSNSAADLSPPSSTGRRRRNKKGQKADRKVVNILLAQDKTALRSRKGDTGSVLWKASVDFAQLVLREIHANPVDSFLDPSILKTQHVVELGAGTGLLAIALSPFVGRYTVTDIKDLVPLLRKNMTLNFDGWPDCLDPTPGSNVFVEEVDWLVLHSTAAAQRLRLVAFEPIDLLLVVDCVYHPSLLPALVETIDCLATPERTVVLVVVELRADDVIREFLEMWLQRPGWEIWRVGGGLLDKPYVMWSGFRMQIK